MTLKEVPYFKSTNNTQPLDLQAIKNNLYVLFPNYNSTLNHALKVLKDKELIQKYRLNKYENEKNENYVKEIENHLNERKMPLNYGMHLIISTLVVLFTFFSALVALFIVFLLFDIVSSVELKQYVNEYKLWLFYFSVGMIFLHSYLFNKETKHKKQEYFKSEIKRLQDSIAANNQKNNEYAAEYNEVMSPIIKDDEALSLNAHLKHSYQTKVEKLQENNFKIIDEMYKKELKITNKIEDLEDGFIILPHDNWILSNVKTVIQKQEYSDIEKDILTSINISV